MWLICGLGNPGKKYYLTKHNVGFILLDSLVKNYNCTLIKKDKSKEIFKGSIEKNNFVLLKPLNYMNYSGIVLRNIANFYKIETDKIIVLHDDLDLNVGKIKFKIGGGNAGHNGLSSIDKEIGKNYNRLRIGINHPGLKDLVSSYVLKKFNKEDKKIIDKVIKILTKEFKIIFREKSLLVNNFSMKMNE